MAIYFQLSAIMVLLLYTYGGLHNNMQDFRKHCAEYDKRDWSSLMVILLGQLALHVLAVFELIRIFSNMSWPSAILWPILAFDAYMLWCIFFKRRQS